jgi:hypothetical protein
MNCDSDQIFFLILQTSVPLVAQQNRYSQKLSTKIFIFIYLISCTVYKLYMLYQNCIMMHTMQKYKIIKTVRLYDKKNDCTYYNNRK